MFRHQRQGVCPHSQRVPGRGLVDMFQLAHARGSSPTVRCRPQAAILKYGPIAKAIGTRNWETYFKRYSDRSSNPRWLTDLPQGIFNGVHNTQPKREAIDHEVPSLFGMIPRVFGSYVVHGGPIGVTRDT
jgi:hypothetical protein